jgi:hypothetical protein
MTLVVAQVPENILPVLLDIQHALEMCQTVDDAAYLRRKSKAMEDVAKEADATLEIKLEATELRIRAERRLGQLLVAAPKNKGAEGKFTGPLGSQVKMDPTPTLAEQGVSKKMAESARSLAKIEAQDFEAIVTAGRQQARNNPSREPSRFLSAKRVVRDANPKPDREPDFSPLIKPSDNWNFATVEYGRINEDGESHGYIPGEIYANCFWYYAPDGGEVCDLMAGSGQAMRVYEDRERWGRGREVNFNLRLFDRLPRGPYREQVEPLDATKGLPAGYHPDYIFMDVPYFGQVVGAYSDHDDDIANMDLAAWSEAMQSVAASCATAQASGALCTVMAPNYCDWEHGRIMACGLIRQWWVAAGYALHDIAYSTRRIQQAQNPTMAKTNTKAKREKLMLSDIAEIQTFRRTND